MREVIEISRDSLFNVIHNAIILYKNRQYFDPVHETRIIVDKIAQGQKPLNYHDHMNEPFSSRSELKEFGFYHDGVWVSDAEYERAKRVVL